jgi:hypothetical protein
MPVMDTGASTLPDDVEALKALLSAALERADEAEARLANAMVRERDRSDDRPPQAADRQAAPRAIWR